MRYSFRLAEILGHDPNPRKRPGTIKAIVEEVMPIADADRAHQLLASDQTFGKVVLQVL